jgi:hypothetical protein
LDGYIAREVARDLPGYVDQEMTMGSLVIGEPMYTAAVMYFDRKGYDLDWVEREAGKQVYAQFNSQLPQFTVSQMKD